jgi:predicted double-glycine peptidase
VGSVLLLALLLIIFALPGYTAVPAQASTWAQSTFTMAGRTTPTTVATVPASTPTPLATTAGQINASKNLVRINQLETNQYNSPQDATTWSYSACSAASLAEVINSWGNYNYRVADILKVEAGINAITPSQGLTTEAGIANTASKFGFTTVWGHNKSLDQVIAAANSGTPVIVSFPPDRYAGGHILVVRGGNANYVDLADSSLYNRTQVTRAFFLNYWEGFYAILTPTPFNIMGLPTISAIYINSVLASAHSPAAGLGQTIIDLAKKYGIDPVFLMAIFHHESQYGLTGEATFTFSPGNERCIVERPCINNHTPPTICLQGQSCYALMKNWEDGFDRLNSLLLNGYVRGSIKGLYLITIDQIIPTFAPVGDGNDTAEYIAVLKQEVTSMRQQSQAA